MYGGRIFVAILLFCFHNYGLYYVTDSQCEHQDI